MWIAIAVVAAVFIAWFALGLRASREIEQGKKAREDFHGRVYRSKE